MIAASSQQERERRSEAASCGDPIVRVNDLTVGWGDVVLQRDLAFEVREGEVFAILGGSGCGKSTLLRYLIGLEPVTIGEVTICGRDAAELTNGPPPFGVTFQAGALFGSSTVGENVGLPLEEWTDLPPEAISAMARAKLRLVGLDGAYSKLPSELSGGMKKRAAIARALALEPKLVFLDEPTTGLDPVTAAEVEGLIATLNRTLGLTFVVVTHELASILSIVHRAIMLDKDAKSAIAIGEPHVLAQSEDQRVSDFFNRRPSRHGDSLLPSPTPENPEGS